ncbi:hypothetical protein [Streptomyces sp. NPDC090053]|uniref:hypothetical protein n=1 Tax=Streptomyces sp. NPDC090053 TaxID=3365932 RepID=UPI00382CCB0F
MVPSKYPNLGFDPAPGDLEAVKLMVSAVSTVTGHSGTAQTELSKIATSDGIWVGKSAKAFSDSVSQIPPYLKKALGSLDSAQRALSSWETQLTAFQSRARKLEQEAAEAASKVSAARGNLDGLTKDTSGMSDKEKDDHAKDEKGKKAACDSANNELEDVRGRAHALHAEFSTAADDSGRLIRNAADDAPPKPGWFDNLVDHIGDFLSDAWDAITDPNFWKLIGDILADVAMVIGVICLVALMLGTGVGVLGLIGFIVGVGALAAHSVALAGGAEGMTWQTLAWDIGGVVAGGIGLGGARIAEAGRALVASGRALRGAEGLVATLSKIGPGNWGGLLKIPSGVANSARGFSTAGKGWMAVASGNLLDWSGTVVGAGLALGSNANDGRWTDGNWNIADIPLLGPFSAMSKYKHPNDKVAAPGPLGPQIHAPATLTSAGANFTNGLEPSQFGAAA